MSDDIAERVIAVIAKTQHIPAERVAADSQFAELNIDSLDGINILFALENEFEVSIPDDAARQIRSVGDAIEGIRKLARGPQGAEGAPTQ
jgi:acyl carrier protein